MPKIILAIDPGAAGGLVWLDSTGHVIRTEKMPTTFPDIHAALSSGPPPDVCIIEDVGHGMPGQSSKATATFARHCGHLEMAAFALRFPLVKVSPARWQNHLKLRSLKGESKAAHKNRIKAFSQLRYPSVKVTLANADALAIATFALETRPECATDS